MSNNIVFECTMSEKNRVYMSGDYASGTIVVEFAELVKIRGIDIRFLGQSTVNWTETKRSQNDSRRIITKVYTNKETYFDATPLLFGRAASDDGETVEHPVGRHPYPFRFQLPPDLPATFEGKHGSVGYAIIGLLDIPWAPDKSFKQKLNVACHLNLNDVPPAKDALIGRDEKMLCFVCCKHGPILAEFAIPQTGWVPGERILINASVTNHSRRKVLKTEVKLKQAITYQSSGKKAKIVNREMMSIVDEEVILKGGSFRWMDEPMILPPCPPTFLPYCGIMDVQYELVFNIDVAGTTIDMEMPLEIIVGTIPLKGSRGGAIPRTGQTGSVLYRVPNRDVTYGQLQGNSLQAQVSQTHQSDVTGSSSTRHDVTANSQ